MNRNDPGPWKLPMPTKKRVCVNVRDGTYTLSDFPFFRYVGYESDGVYGFQCLACKAHFAVRGRDAGNFCAHCGVMWIGAILWQEPKRVEYQRQYWQEESKAKREGRSGRQKPLPHFVIEVEEDIEVLVDSEDNTGGRFVTGKQWVDSRWGACLTAKETLERLKWIRHRDPEQRARARHVGG